MKKLKTGLTKKSYSLKFLQYGLRQDDYEENKSTRLDTCIITCMETTVGWSVEIFFHRGEYIN